MRHHGSPLAAPLALTAAAALALTSCGVLDEFSNEDSGPPVGEETPPPPSTSPEPPDQRPESGEQLLQQQGVSAGHPLAAEVGERILADGGNAVDAAVATAFAVSVVEPYASGIGGGGSVIIAGPQGEPIFHDYREVVNNDGEIPDSGSGVPGFVAGMGQLHEEYGSMEWSDLLAPAQELAAEGFELSPFLALRMSQPDGEAAIADLENYAPGGEPLSAGEQLVQPELAQTLQRLSEAGWQDFYTGELAESLAEEVEGVDTESLADYEVVLDKPVAGSFGEYQILAPAPSLPGPAMVQMLQIAEAHGIAETEPGTAEYIDLLSDAWLVAEETVYSEIGDPAFVDVPVERLTDADANAQIDLSPQAAAVSAEPQAGSAEEGKGVPDSQRGANTTHISVVDETGLSVSMTNTIMYFWGSGQMVDGYFVNNHLSRFDAITSGANQPAPGRRTVTWSHPAMVLDDQDRPVLIIGSPGGHQILNILGSVLTQWGLHGRSLEDAVALPRFRADQESIYLEEGTDDAVAEALEDAGWATEIWPDASSSFGSVQPLEINYEEGAVTSVDDSRREGAHRIID